MEAVYYSDRLSSSCLKLTYGLLLKFGIGCAHHNTSRPRSHVLRLSKLKDNEEKMGATNQINDSYVISLSLIVFNR
jgi:hypothetical protein